ncbi:TOTE conflict system archaeo-eukaryotic primase domain-containing protein [Microbacterium sp. A1-JK]|uniref:TOTE conflict system archaeo-eukaryotic primase domain-containing protein n=1 Tax=Microbacterium sp. A1-JK TaxID=3177516 RepID=UPI0038883CEC
MITRNSARARALTLETATGVSPYSLDEVWALTRRLSPRPQVRVAARDASGEILNEYDRLWPLNEEPPSTTWAMLLADEDHRFTYLCFDFDTTSGNVLHDSARLVYWLEQLNIPHLLCISGPGGGRHVWVHLEEPAEADRVLLLAKMAKQLLPSLDIQPLTNAAAGCVRPPYAPHRAGGYSDPQGDLRFLTEHAAGPEAVSQLTELFVEAGAELVLPKTALPHNVVEDSNGHPRMRGPKRRLSQRMEDVLFGPAGNDPSYTLARLLIACANVRWSYDDIYAHVESTDSFEHARSKRRGTGRISRTAAQTEKVLSNLWRYAVNFVAMNPLLDTGDDSDFRNRMTTVTNAVSFALERADARPGLWATHNNRVGGTHSQRAVLDALCLYMLQSAQHVVEADVRRLSADTGYGRTTVSNALRALCSEGTGPAWIERVGVAEGVHGQKYRLRNGLSTGEETTNRTQARMRAEPQPLASCHQLIREISERLELLAHDIFAAPQSLGRTAGLVYKLLPPEGGQSTGFLAMRAGVDPEQVRKRLHRLVETGLASRGPAGWRRHSPAARDFAARGLCVDGYLNDRRQRYEHERIRWAWWLAEETWMKTTGKRRRGKKPTPWAALTDRAEFVAYPRGPNGRGDHMKALELVRAGYLSQGLALAA